MLIAKVKDLNVHASHIQHSKKSGHWPTLKVLPYVVCSTQLICNINPSFGCVIESNHFWCIVMKRKYKNDVYLFAEDLGNQNILFIEHDKKFKRTHFHLVSSTFIIFVHEMSENNNCDDK